MNKVNFIFLDGSEMRFDILKDVSIIGRDPSCDIVLPFQGFSRQHVRLEISKGKIYVTDLKSSNGVMINGKKISPESKTLYPTTSNLQFGPLQSATILLADSDSTRVKGISLVNLESKENEVNQEATKMIKIPKLVKQVSEVTKKSTLVQVVEEPKKQSNLPMILGATAVLAIAVGAGLYMMGFI